MFINYATGEIILKIVYYGPGLCGKTTNLQSLHTVTPEASRSKLLSLATKSDRTLFFDLLPMEIGTLAGMKIRLQLYTVPGQVFYNSTRQMVLKGADGVVLVVDSQRPLLANNIESFKNLKENLRELGMDPDDIPLVIQYNKRDLQNIVPVAELEGIFNGRGLPSFEACALTQTGVRETLKEITRQVLHRLPFAPDSKETQEGKQEAPDTPPSTEKTASEEFAATEEVLEDADLLGISSQEEELLEEPPAQPIDSEEDSILDIPEDENTESWLEEDDDAGFETVPLVIKKPDSSQAGVPPAIPTRRPIDTAAETSVGKEEQVTRELPSEEPLAVMESADLLEPSGQAEEQAGSEANWVKASQAENDTAGLAAPDQDQGIELDASLLEDIQAEEEATDARDDYARGDSAEADAIPLELPVEPSASVEDPIVTTDGVDFGRLAEAKSQESVLDGSAQGEALGGADFELTEPVEEPAPAEAVAPAEADGIDEVEEIDGALLEQEDLLDEFEQGSEEEDAPSFEEAVPAPSLYDVTTERSMPGETAPQHDQPEEVTPKGPFIDRASEDSGNASEPTPVQEIDWPAEPESGLGEDGRDLIGEPVFGDDVEARPLPQAPDLVDDPSISSPVSYHSSDRLEHWSSPDSEEESESATVLEEPLATSEPLGQDELPENDSAEEGSPATDEEAVSPASPPETLDDEAPSDSPEPAVEPVDIFPPMAPAGELPPSPDAEEGDEVPALLSEEETAADRASLVACDEEEKREETGEKDEKDEQAGTSEGDRTDTDVEPGPTDDWREALGLPEETPGFEQPPGVDLLETFEPDLDEDAAPLEDFEPHPDHDANLSGAVEPERQPDAESLDAGEYEPVPDAEPLGAGEYEPVPDAEPLEAAEYETELDAEPLDAAEDQTELDAESLDAAEPQTEPDDEPLEAAEPEPKPNAETLEVAEPETEPYAEPLGAAEPEPDAESLEAAESVTELDQELAKAEANYDSQPIEENTSRTAAENSTPATTVKLPDTSTPAPMATGKIAFDGPLYQGTNFDLAVRLQGLPETAEGDRHVSLLLDPERIGLNAPPLQIAPGSGATFSLVATTTGWHRIQAIAIDQGRLLARMGCELFIYSKHHDGAPYATYAEPAPSTIDLRFRTHAPDLLIGLMTDRIGDDYRLSYSICLRGQVTIPRPVTLTNSPVLACRRAISVAVEETTGQQAAALARSGATLYNLLLPQDLRRLLEREEDLSIIVASEDSWLPWEILRPDPDSPPIGERHRIGQWPGRTTPRGSIASASGIQATVDTEASGEPLPGHAVCHDPEGMLEALTGIPRDLIYVCGQGLMDPSLPAFASINLGDDNIQAADLKRVKGELREGRPWIILEILSPDENDRSLGTGAAAWASTLLSRIGAGGLVAPRVPLPASQSLLPRILEPLRAGKTIGEAVRSIRSAAKEPAMKTLALFGDPQAILVD